MGSSEQQDPPRTTPAAHIVGNAFVDQYYHMLHESPELVHRFYQDVSKFGRPEKNGIMGITSTMEDINKKILSLGYDELSVEIISVDAQESYGGGVLVLVTGCITGKDKIKQKFTQCFFLAPQEKGYFVLNDVFRYVNDDGGQGSAHDFESPITPDHVEDPSVLEKQVSEQISVTAVDGDAKEVVYNAGNGEASTEEEEAPVPDVVDEIPDGSRSLDGSVSPIEGAQKKSYASIVKVMKGSARPSFTAATSVRSSIKSQEKQGAVPAPLSMSETNGSLINTKEIANSQEAEAEGYSIHVKGLSSTTTPFLLESVFKKFGPIKNGGIQVRSQKGFCFGFVEFEVANAAQSALEASPILIEGRHVVVEEKRSTNRVNSKGRFSSGRRPGSRGEGARERGNYGNGRSYGRGGDFGHRNGNQGGFSNHGGDFGHRNGNQGGFSNHGGDRHQRGEHMGSSGGRRNRTGGLAVNSAVKTTAVHVAASA